jgi:hypothetical protein
MEFKAFQNDVGVLRRYEINRKGTKEEAEAIVVKCDVQYKQDRRVRDGEEIHTSALVFVTANPAIDAVPLATLRASTWRLQYDGTDNPVMTIERVRKPANRQISHYELTLQ